jgi:hypothetical protein
MDEQLVHTYTRGDWTAEIYSSSMPGEFQVVYRNSRGDEVERINVTGVSSYHQREKEILARVDQLRKGGGSGEKPDLGDAGEY